MSNKQIVFTDAYKAELLDVPYEKPKANQVLVKMEYTAISAGTEKANYTGDVNVSANSNATVAKFPRYAGYSGSGVVIDVGENVTKVKVGDRVAGIWGLHKKYSMYPEDDVVIINEEVSLKEAALSHIATFPMAAVRKTRVEFDRMSEMLEDFGKFVLREKKNPYSYEYELKLHKLILACTGLDIDYKEETIL